MGSLSTLLGMYAGTLILNLIFFPATYFGARKQLNLALSWPSLIQLFFGSALLTLIVNMFVEQLLPPGAVNAAALLIPIFSCYLCLYAVSRKA